jgi:glutathione S-transferase
MSVHIVARAFDIPVELERVDGKTRRTSDGVDFCTINPKGYIPALALDNGEVLTETSVIIQYLADTRPQSGLMPALGIMQRYRVQEWLNFIATEIHKNLAPLFYPITEAHRETVLAALSRRLDVLDKALQGKEYLMETFTVADAYAFTVLNYTKLFGQLKVSLEPWPNVKAYVERISQRPRVREAMSAEGLPVMTA